MYKMYVVEGWGKCQYGSKEGFWSAQDSLNFKLEFSWNLSKDTALPFYKMSHIFVQDDA